jgi:hypothetical protein
VIRFCILHNWIGPAAVGDGYRSKKKSQDGCARLVAVPAYFGAVSLFDGWPLGPVVAFGAAAGEPSGLPRSGPLPAVGAGGGTKSK